MSPILKKIELTTGENVVRFSHTRHLFDDMMSMIGHLVATNKRLCFFTDKRNFSQYSVSIPLSEIVEVQIKNRLKWFADGLLITLKNGETHHFAVWKRRQWKQVIERYIHA